MQRAEILFRRFLDGGEKEIDKAIADRESEQLFLDFKRSTDGGRSGRLDDKDRANLAKAISGFGNSEGGVVVWGVDCRDVDGSGDVARMKMPITNPERFKSWLEDAVSKVTLPVHPKVEHGILNSGDGTGFVITHVPKSAFAPHQVQQDGIYYTRSGSSFTRVTHGILQGMFGHPSPAHLSHEWRQLGIQIVPAVERARKVIVDLGLLLRSHGPGICRDLFASVAINTYPSHQSRSIFGITNDVHWRAESVRSGEWSAVTSDGFKLAPSAPTAVPLSLRLVLEPPFTHALSCQLTYGHGASPINVSVARIEGDVLSALFERLQPGANDRINDGEFGRLFMSAWSGDA